MVIYQETRLRNDLSRVEWDVKHCSATQFFSNKLTTLVLYSSL